MSDLQSESEDRDGLNPALRAGFGRRAESAVAGLPGLAGSARRVHLDDEIEGELIDPRSPEAFDTGHYRVDGEIARGGVGIVLKGHDVDLGRDVAFKVLREEHASNAELVARFVEEAQIGGQLQHPGIVPVYELGVRADRRPFFTMKLVKGRTLSALLAERKDPAEDRRRFLAIFEAVCQTLAYAHARGVVHRDLKPSNVMVGAFGEVQVVDWGLAKVLARGGVADERRSRPDASVIATVRSGSGSASLAGSVMGTPAYMPPEQARGEVERIDERSDVFSLGAILCEILTGAPPYTGEGALQLEQATKAELDDARARLEACGAEAELVKIAKGCLRSEPRTRPRNSNVVAKKVGEYFASTDARRQAAQLEAAEARARALAERKARKLTLSLGGALLAAITLGGAGWWWVDLKHRERRFRTDRAVETALAELRVLRERGDLAGAVAAAERAAGLAATGGASPELRDRASQELSEMERIERDMRMKGRLEEIRTKGFIRDWRGANAAYATAFREFGIDVEALSVADAAARIRETTIPHELAVSLDWWVGTEGIADNDDQVGPHKLGAIIVSVVGGVGNWPAAGSRSELAEHAAAVNVDDDSPESIDLLAMKLALSGDPDGARALYVRAVRRHPGNFFLNLGAATCSAKIRPVRLVDARVYAQAAVALKPESDEAWNLLGIILRNSTDFEGAVSALRTATEIDPDDPVNRTNLGDALGALGRFDESLSEHRQAVALESTPEGEARSGSYLGHILFGMGEEAAAEAECRLAIELDHNCEEAWFLLGSLLGSRGEFEPAMEALREAIDLDPDLLRAHYLLARCLEAVGRTAEALEEIEREKALGPSKELDIYEDQLLAKQRQLGVIAALIRGEPVALSASDKLAAANELYTARRFGLALRLASEALEEEPSLAGDLDAGHLYNAACSAALVASGAGIDLVDVDAETRVRARVQALAWLQENLVAWERRLEGGRVSQRDLRKAMEWWLSDGDLAILRDPELLAALSQAERSAAEAVWSRVRDLAREPR